MKLAEVIARVKSLEVKIALLLNVETRNSQLAKDVSENKEIIFELKEKDVFQTKSVNELKSKLKQSMNKFEKIEILFFNMASLVNVLENKLYFILLFSSGIPCHFDRYFYPGIFFQSREIQGNNIPLFMHYI